MTDREKIEKILEKYDVDVLEDTDVIAGEIMTLIEARDAELIKEWFEKGSNSVKRENKSGCACIISDNEEIEDVCACHEAWAQVREKKLREALGWACERINMLSAETKDTGLDLCGTTKCEGCPIKQALK